MSAIDNRYAHALASVIDEKKLDAGATVSQLADFLAALGVNPQLREVLEDPSIPEPQKLGLLDALAAKLGLSGSVRNFLALITHHQRLNSLADITASFTAIAEYEANVAEVEVVSARELDASSRAALEGKIGKLVEGRKLSARYTQDASLLGGAVVRIGSTVYDGSIRGQLQQMKQRLIAAAV